MADVTYEVHPAAAVFPMLPDDELQALTDDIAANGLLHPIVRWTAIHPETPWKDAVRFVLDGRNRLRACELADVEPVFVDYDGDPVAYVLSANVARRHMTTGARAMATAVVLAAEGRRKDGKWAYGAATTNGEDSRSSWRKAMELAGLVLDVTPEVAPAVIAGAVSLHAAHADAVKARADAESLEARFARLPADLAELVREERMTLDDALAAAADRDRRRAEERRDARALLARVVDLVAPELPPADFAESWATHLGDVESELVARIDAAIDVLTDLAKRVRS